MANAVVFDYYPDLAGTVEMPADRGVFTNSGLILFQRQSLPTDPIGTYALTLNNVPAGSRVHIESQDGTTTLSDEVATGTNGTFVTYNKTLQVYAGGSPLNNWRIKVRKASESPYYRPYETLMTATVGSGSVYVSMIQDD